MREAGPIVHQTARQRRGRARPQITLNLTAMIDVTFLLLVYFLVATEFRMGEEVYQLDLPERGAVVEEDPFDLPKEPLRIAVSSVGRDLSGYRVQMSGARDQPRTFTELYQDLLNLQLGMPGGMYAEDHPIVIEPTANARWEHVMEAFNAAARARYSNINLGKAG